MPVFGLAQDRFDVVRDRPPALPLSMIEIGIWRNRVGEIGLDCNGWNLPEIESNWLSCSHQKLFVRFLFNFSHKRSIKSLGRFAPMNLRQLTMALALLYAASPVTLGFFAAHHIPGYQFDAHSPTPHCVRVALPLGNVAPPVSNVPAVLRRF
jgi:hypothetical protein